VIIERLQTDQFAEIITLLTSFGLPTDDLDSADISIFGIHVDNQLVGCIGLELFDKLGLLRSLAVDINHQSKGVGEELVKFLEELASGEGLRELFLLTETAEKFFNKLNYILVDRSLTPELLKSSAEFSHLFPDSAVLMMKKL